MSEDEGAPNDAGRHGPERRRTDDRVAGPRDDDDDARLDALRTEIAEADRALIEVLGRRLRLAREIGEIKRRAGRPVMDPAREAEVVRAAAAAARERGVDPELVRDVIWRVMAQARGVQDDGLPTS